MRSDCAWSMSTVGLSAQKICLPAQSSLPFLRGSYCHSMAGSKPSWSHQHDLNNLYFSMDSSHTEYSLRTKQPVSLPPSLSLDRNKHSPTAQRLPPKKSRPTQLSLSSSHEPSSPSPAEDDQVVPCFQRLSVYERSSPPQTPGRCAKPLPPLPLPIRADVSPDQAMDHEVELYTSSDDSRCLVPGQPCPKPSTFRYGLPSHRSFRGCGQINYAYFEGPSAEQPRQQEVQQEVQQEQQEEQKPPEPPEPPVVACQRQQERNQIKLRRSHSGPAGSFNKPTSLRLSCRHRHAYVQSQAMDKPEVPPRVPIPPRPVKSADYRRWSAEVSSGAYSDEDRPPKVPPRDPLAQGSSRTPSPKSLPTYLNGVMPPTQSFAPDPKYVSRGLQRQNSEGSPCILPVIEHGRKSSTTHYFLLPQRPAYLDKPCLEKFLRGLDSSDSAGARSEEGPDSQWDCQTRRKARVDIV
ncbi:ERBB receptor feedback inhibitor 1a [Osmerus mordax]|uniref:ERBB receptor feedback inhibitor 1a n=1 Tax=Osmerus mordax TaxID=8014 RepID=UPI00350ED2F7